MSDPKYLKCPCQKCGGSIEFPAQGLGLGVNCPHCGQRTTLFAPEAIVEESLPDTMPPAPEPPAAATPPKQCPSCGATLGPEMEVCPQCGGKSRSNLVRVVAVIVLLVLGASATGFLYFKKRPAGASKQRPSVPVKSNASATIAFTNSSAPLPAAAKAPKSIDDLKVGTIMLEKAKSGSLVYAVGVLKNDSDYPRYGVKIELDVSDAKSTRASKASDYTQVIEPRKEWRFRALVLDSKATSAKLSKITEDE
jgi:hypothetical protein